MGLNGNMSFLLLLDDLEVSTIYYEFANTLIWICVAEILVFLGMKLEDDEEKRCVVFINVITNLS